MEDYIIEMRNITKIFPGIIANDDITIQLQRGEIHALLGENGAGKSTLMSVLFGLYQPDKGQIYYEGKPVKINNPNDATKLGIGMVHQHFKLVECFTVLENIILGVEDSKVGFVSKKDAREKVVQLIAKYGLYVDLDAKISDITVGMQQRTEILKMLYRENDILIFDEPTAVLTPQEIDELMDIMRLLKKEGKSILFISHKLNEIMSVCDRCTVLRKGKVIRTKRIEELDVEKLSAMMVGRTIHFKLDKEDIKPGERVLDVRDLCVVDQRTKKYSVNHCTFHVDEGEIVCIAGIDGNGQTDLVYALTGLSKVQSGRISLNGENITDKNIRFRNTHGLSHVPEDRQRHGLVLDYSLEQNMVLQRYFENEFSKHGFINFKAVREYTERLIEEYDIRSGQGPITIERSMSGGNQQKSIIAREMDKEHDLLITVQPTRGLDVGAIESIHSKILQKRSEKKAILLVSLELDEVMNLSDRIYVMYEGSIVGEFRPENITTTELGLYMSGAKNDFKVEGEEYEE